MRYEGSYETVQADRIEQLRLILQKQQLRPISYLDAQAVAESLVTFYEVLASDAENTLYPLNTQVKEHEFRA